MHSSHQEFVGTTSWSWLFTNRDSKEVELPLLVKYVRHAAEALGHSFHAPDKSEALTYN